MTTPASVRYANTGPIAELVVREQIIDGLAELRNSREQLDELTTRFDELQQGTQTEWARQCRDLLLSMLDPESGQLVSVSLGHPDSDAVLPWVGIVDRGASEDIGGATIGDVLRTETERIGDHVTDPTHFRLRKHTTHGTTMNLQVEIATWAVAQEMSIVLQEAVQYVLFRRKGQLAKAGVHDVSMRTEGFSPREDMMPRVSYVPLLVLTCTVQRRMTRVQDNVPWKVSFTYSFASS